LGDSERALSDYEQAVTLDELYIPAYINRGALYTRLGIFGLAINDLTLALSLSPDNVAALNNRAVVHAIEGNYDLALVDLDAAIEIDDENPRTYVTRAAVYSALAARDYQEYVEVTEQNTLPAGTPADVMVSVDDSIRTGDFSIWLSLLTAASEATG
jgi:tetratricopeptide (TPR) repeat protein